MPSPRASNRHRILRQVLELEFGPGAGGAELQGSVARVFRERGLPALEALFDQAAGPESFVRLDRLEIDLGPLEGAGWEAAFQQRLTEQMAKRLAECRPAIGNPSTGRPNEASEDSGSITWRQWLFFLAHGRLPWWGGKPGADWPETLLSRLRADGWPSLRRLLAADRNARRRLVHCAGDTFLATVGAAWTGLPAIEPVLAGLSPAGLSAEAARRWRGSFWTVLLDWAAEEQPIRDGPALMKNLLEQRDSLTVSDRPGESWTHPQTNGPPDATAASERQPALPQPWRQWLEEALITRSAEKNESNARPSLERSSRVPEKPEASGLDGEQSSPPGGRGKRPYPVAVGASKSARPAQATRESNTWSSPPSPGENETIYLEGAGVVILHPFLETLFNDRGWLEQRHFRDERDRQRAMHLLGLLSFGREAVPEYDLVLAKLLCGLPPEEPLEPRELTDEDRQAADTLLRAVLGHWTALRSESPEWLRQQFFLREGTLEPVDFGWRLTVERRAQDVLLARLPWGLGVIRLPWMEGQLHVGWLD